MLLILAILDFRRPSCYLRKDLEDHGRKVEIYCQLERSQCQEGIALSPDQAFLWERYHYGSERSEVDSQSTKLGKRAYIWKARASRTTCFSHKSDQSDLISEIRWEVKSDREAVLSMPEGSEFWKLRQTRASAASSYSLFPSLCQHACLIKDCLSILGGECFGVANRRKFSFLDVYWARVLRGLSGLN